MNWASSSTNKAASANSVTTSHKALATGLRRVMQASALASASPANAQNRTSAPDTLLAFGVGGVPQRRHGMRLGAQPLQIVHEAVARVLRVLVMHPHVDLLLGVLHRHLRSPQVAEGEGHALERGAQVGDLAAGALHHLDADRHQARSSATEPATRWPRSSPKNSGIASRTFRTNRTSPKRVS